MDDVVVLVFGRENGNNETDKVSDEMGNDEDKMIGIIVSTLVIGAPVSDTLTTISKVGTSSETDLVVTTSSGMVVEVEICEVIGRETFTTVEIETGGVSGTTSSSDDSLRIIIFRFL